MGNVTGFFHGGVTVQEIDRSLVFYRDGLALEIEFDRMLDAPYLKEVLGLSFDAIRAVYLRIPGGGFVELLEYRGIERLPAASRPCDPGAGHLCLYVDDVQAVFDRLTALGFRARHDAVTDITAGPNTGARSAYFADPDGYYVELFQKRPGA
ncbi:MAG TPA: VOC family protein [Candidatus Sulfomarinibacteraceae bacterium]|nr:VOC family protein [Candidatus Sulfomarinibacteraceae bacterium]